MMELLTKTKQAYGNTNYYIKKNRFQNSGE